MVIRIEWLSDSVECDTCGENYADGAHVFFDDEFAIDMTPHAACFNGSDYDASDVYQAILNRLGHVVQETYGGDE